jgi:hypothetical protein
MKEPKSTGNLLRDVDALVKYAKYLQARYRGHPKLNLTGLKEADAWVLEQKRILYARIPTRTEPYQRYERHFLLPGRHDDED